MFCKEKEPKEVGGNKQRTERMKNISMKEEKTKMKASKEVEGEVRWIRSCESTLNRLYIQGLLVHTFGRNTSGLVRPGLPYKQDTHTRQTLPTHFYTLTCGTH